MDLKCRKLLKNEEQLFLHGLKLYHKKINLANFLRRVDEIEKKVTGIQANLEGESGHNLTPAARLQICVTWCCGTSHSRVITADMCAPGIQCRATQQCVSSVLGYSLPMQPQVWDLRPDRVIVLSECAQNGNQAIVLTSLLFAA